ncbi:hypothetical protein LCGC14_2931150, partial [marine sediment metagenome]
MNIPLLKSQPGALQNTCRSLAIYSTY